MKREKDTLVAFRLTDERAREFKALCAWKKTSIQSVLEDAVNEFIAREKKKTE